MAHFLLIFKFTPLYGHYSKDEPWYTKVTWNIIIPILTGIVGAIGVTVILEFFDEMYDD